VRIPILLTALLVSMVSTPAGAASGRSITPFDLLEDGSIIVSVTIGGTGPYRFLLDTGSSRTVIATRLWQTLRRPVVARTVMVTPAGRDLAFIVRLDRFGVGPLPPVTLDAAVMAADRYAAGQQVDGLIGQDVLAGAVYTIDYRARTIRWHAAEDALPGFRLPLKISDQRVLVVLPQRESDQQPLALIPDSGSDAFVMFAHARGKLRFTPLDVDVLRSLSGVKLVRRIQIDELIVGEARLRDAPGVIVDNGESADMMGDGLLPLHVFSRVTFNVRERYLIVDAPLNSSAR
jgi:predicted aspartyl protease